MTVAVARPFAIAAILLVLAGCAIPPKPERPSVRDEAPLSGLSSSGGRAWPDPEWWKHYRDPQLDDLEQKALAASPSLDEAHKRFGTALRSIDIARAAGGFSAQGNAQVQRLRLSEHGLIPSEFLGFTWYNQGDLSAQFQYDFDFWGKNRAAVKASVDEARAAEAERATATLLLTTAVADTYFGWQADQTRLVLARQSRVALTRNRDLAGKRVARGIDSPDSLHQADGQLAAVHEAEVGYAGSAQVRLAAIAALLAIAPANLPALDPKALPQVDLSLPDNIGFDLVARRPDIAASRWRIEAAMARVEQARAEFYPDISLGAMVGLQSVDLDKLFQAGSRIAGIGPALHLPLFNQSRLRAAYGVSQSQLDAAASQYDATIVDAARDVATQALTLRQIDARRRARGEQVAAMEALQKSVAARVRRGLGDDRSLLVAEADVLQQRDAAAALDAQALATEIALTKALGGGYHVTATDTPDSAGKDSAPIDTAPSNPAQRAH